MSRMLDNARRAGLAQQERYHKRQLEFAQRYVYGGCFRRESWKDYLKRKGWE